MTESQLWRYLEEVAELQNGWWYNTAVLPVMILAVSAYLLMILAMRQTKNPPLVFFWLLLAGMPTVLVMPSLYIRFNLTDAVQRINFTMPNSLQTINRAQAIELSRALDTVATLGITGGALTVAVLVVAAMRGGYVPRTISQTISTAISTVTTGFTKAVSGGRRRKVSSPYGKLTIEQSSASSGSEYGVRNNQVIGKREADIIIADNIVSRRHARLIVNGDQVCIEDLGSTNGTFVKRGSEEFEVNGMPFALQHDDQIFLGPPDEVSSVRLKYTREQ